MKKLYRDDLSLRAFDSESKKSSQISSYVKAMKALQDRIKILEEQLSQRPICTHQHEISQEQKLFYSEQSRSLKDEIQSLKVQQLNNQSNIASLERNVYQSNETIIMLKEHNETLTNERIVYLNQYKERYDKLYQQMEGLRLEKEDMEHQLKIQDGQLEVFREQQRSTSQRYEAYQSQEVHRLNHQISEQKTIENNLVQKIRMMEKQITLLQEEKKSIEQELLDYKENVPLFRLQDLERQLAFVRNQMDEKEKFFQKRSEESQANYAKSLEQSTKRVQDLLNKMQEQQILINNLNYELCESKLRSEQLQQRLNSRHSKNRQFFSSMDIPTQSDEEAPQAGMRQNSESNSAPNTKHASPRYVKEKRREYSDLYVQQEEQSPPRKGIKTIQKQDDDKSVEYEVQLRFLNQRYEQLLQQATSEKDINQRAAIRKELLRLTEQIKFLNQQLYSRR